MFNTRLGMTIVGLFVAVMATAGCNQAELDQLKKDKTELQDQNKALKEALAAADERERENAAKINAMQGKEAELATLTAENEGLKRQLAQKPAASTATPTASGWIASTFGDSVTVGGDILFGSGKAALTDAGKHRLDQIAKDLKTTYAGRPVRIYGHTDTDPITKSNWDDNLELSANRAMAVTRYLRTKGINTKLVETIAMGEYHPEPGAKDKAKNRRVEIFVVKSGVGKPTASE